MLLIVAAKPLTAAFGIYKTGLDVTFLAVGTCLVMLAIAQRNTAGGKFTAPLRWYGRHSYEIYLTHMFLVFAATRVFISMGLSLRWVLPVYVITLLLAGLAGAFVARYFSEPLNRTLRETFHANRTAEIVSQK